MNSVYRWMALVLLMSPMQGFGQTAREYFDELVKANSLNTYQDEYACFRDDEVPSFAVVSTADSVRSKWKQNGVKIPKGFEKDQGLFLKTYYKGIANKAKLFDKDGDEYSLTFNVKDQKNAHMKMVYTINWDTGRYRMRLYELSSSKTMPAYEVSGKCELIHRLAK
ncbi:MAG: hypothetical protein ACJ71Q_08990 [Terriglobales bacterium]